MAVVCYTDQYTGLKRKKALSAVLDQFRVPGTARFLGDQLRRVRREAADLWWNFYTVHRLLAAAFHMAMKFLNESGDEFRTTHNAQIYGVGTQEDIDAVQRVLNPEGARPAAGTPARKQTLAEAGVRRLEFEQVEGQFLEGIDFRAWVDEEVFRMVEGALKERAKYVSWPPAEEETFAAQSHSQLQFVARPMNNGASRRVARDKVVNCAVRRAPVGEQQGAAGQARVMKAAKTGDAKGVFAAGDTSVGGS